MQPTDALLPADPIVDYEYQAASPHVQWGDQVAEWARDVGSGASTPIAKTLAIHHAIGDRMDFVTDATEVGTPVSEIFEKHQGVCQDYSHLALAAYRSVGMAARYVSGYFYAAASGAEPTSDEIQVETHAWVEVAIPGFGWWGLDPTNQQVASERHVKIGHGRDYEDVTPLRGIYHGETDSTELASWRHHVAFRSRVGGDRTSAGGGCPTAATTAVDGQFSHLERRHDAAFG